MNEQPVYTQRFDAVQWAHALLASSTMDEPHWRLHLSDLSSRESYFLEKECLVLFSPEKFHYWFNLYAMVDVLNQDPILASLRNPAVWLYALENAGKKHGCRVLHTYWTSVGIMRPQEHFEPDLLTQIHGAVQSLVMLLDEEKEPWSASLTPGVIACPEEMALLGVDEDTVVQALAHHTLKWRDLGAIAELPIVWGLPKVLVRVVEMNCFPHRYPEQPLPWPVLDSGWNDALLLAQCIVQRHPHLARWWSAPQDMPPVPKHLEQGVLALDLGMQLNYMATFKDWMAEHAPAPA